MNNESMGSPLEGGQQHQPPMQLPPLPPQPGAEPAAAGAQLPPLPQPGANQQAPTAPAYGQPAPLHPPHATGASPAGPMPQQPYGAAPMQPGAPVPPAPGQPHGDDTHRRRRRNGIIAGIAAAVVIALALGAWGVLALTSRAGAGSPEEAVERAIKSGAGFDFVQLSQMVSPSEFGIVSGPATELMNSGAGGNEDAGIPSIQSAVQEMYAATSVELENFEANTDEIADGVVAVEVEDGTLTIDGDQDRFNEGMRSLERAISYEFALMNGSTESEAVERADQSIDDYEEVELPIVTELDSVEFGGRQLPYRMVTVEEGGRWFVSPVMSSFIAAAESTGSPSGAQTNNEVLDADPADSPEEAGMQAFTATVEFASALFSGGADFGSLIETLALPERRALSLFILPMFDSGGSGGFGATPSAMPEVTGEFEKFEAHGVTMVRPARVEVRATSSYGGSDMVTVFEGDCVTNPNGERSCLADGWQGYEALGLDEVGLVVVKEDGGWVVSLYDTIRIAAKVATKNYLELRENGELHRLRV